MNTEKNRKDIVKRLHYAAGHLKAVEKMVEEDVYCLDIVNQNHAVIEALKKINHMILEGYLGVCAWDAVNSKNSKHRQNAIREMVKLYTKQ